jgi:hypothetical protein
MDDPAIRAHGTTERKKNTDVHIAAHVQSASQLFLLCSLHVVLSCINAYKVF